MHDGRPELVLTHRPQPWRVWFADVLAHREVLSVLARKDFQTRYKRASFGVLWAVVVPVLQGAVMAFVFAKIVRVGGGAGYAAYVMSGFTAWSYFTGTLSAGSTAVVDGASLSDKVWFPRLVLVLVPAVSGLVGLFVSIGVVLMLTPIIDVEISPKLFLLVPGCMLLVALTVSLTLVLSALHVYFRDVRFIVQSALLVWLYVTPVVYPQTLLGGYARWIDFNPMTGVVNTIHQAVGQGAGASGRAVVVTIVSTVVLMVVGLTAHRHHDRLFVDLL